MTIDDGNLTRRRFLALAAGSAAAGACSSSPVGPDSVGDVPAMNVSALSVPSLEPIGDLPVAIARDANGIYAMTLTCTHAGCNIGTTGTVSLDMSQPAALQCGTRSCGHGSRYDANGNVIRGPAPGALQHFAVSKDDSGNLTIHGSQFVDMATRLPVT